MSGLVLYAIPHSSYCAKTRILLRFKKLSWTEVPPPGGSSSAEYRAVVPNGNLPAMVHNGLLLADSEAIAEYIEESFPDPPALPDDIRARAKVRERSRFHDTRLNPALAKVYPLVAQRAEQVATIGVVLRDVEERLRQFGHMLDMDSGPPAQLTLGDCGFPITFAWIDKISAAVDRPVQWNEGVVRYRAVVENFDAVTEELRSYHPHMDEWIRAKLRTA